jgi:hypothetical protein
MWGHVLVTSIVRLVKTTEIMMPSVFSQGLIFCVTIIPNRDIVEKIFDKWQD